MNKNRKEIKEVILCEKVDCTYDGQCTNEFTGKRWICKGCVFNKAVPTKCEGKLKD